MKKTIHDQVSGYYGKTLQSSSDLKTNACCTNIEYPKYIKSVLAELHNETLSKYYGCGLTIPHVLKGLTVLDLGSGSGRDCYLLSKLVGEHGKVIGIDMTDEQVEVANAYKQYHANKFGFSNVDFIKGNIERLGATNIKKESLDLIISNCVINLATDKKAVLQGAYNLLKEGGEIYFSDIYSDRRVPEILIHDPVLYGECLSGALYWNDFLNIAKSAGFLDPRVISSNKITIEDEEVESKVGNINFYSVTYRLMKLPELESDCEDYGQAIRYKGTIEENPDYFELDDHHYFEQGRIYSVCGNTYMMLKNTRFQKHFEFWGDFSTHYGIFEGCGESAPFSKELPTLQDSSACC